MAPVDPGSLPPVVSVGEWEQAVSELRRQEKELTRQGDRVSAQRRRLPMVEVSSDYEFDTNDGVLGFHDLFDDRRQLIVYHFMFGPDWDAGCVGCSWVADAMTHPEHLRARDTNLVMVSRAPLAKLNQHRERLGWNLPPWYSSAGSSFNVDMGATVGDDEHHGVSVFLRDNAKIYRTYFNGDRGVEHLGSHWTYLDLTPFGRSEDWEDSPSGWPRTSPYGWLRHHDNY